MGRLYRALIHHCTLLAAAAVIRIILRHYLPHDAEVVETRLDAVVGAAADTDLELVRQLDVVPAFVECLMQIPSQRLSVNQAMNTNRSLAGYNGTDSGTRTTGIESGLGNEVVERLNILVGQTLNLHCQAGRHGSLAVSEFPGRLSDFVQLLIRQQAVHSNDTGHKVFPIPRHDVPAPFQRFFLCICNLQHGLLSSSRCFSFLSL